MAVQLGSAFGSIEIGTGGAERSVATLANSMRRVGGAMSVAITAPLLLIGKAALSATGDFEQALNTMQVVSGATGEQMAALSATALQLGKDTSFSAGEAAAGMLELAKAGMSAEQVTAAIAGTMDLAAAGGLSVAQAAEISANALNAFKLPASDAGRVADVLAAAANASSIEVTDMAMSFQMASAVFASNGQSIEDLATATALLGNNGIKASDAGTSLKAMLIRLTAPVDAAAGVMADLGIEVYNADGSMRSFEDIVYSLQTATAGLTDEQRNQALTTIFGADAIRAANILINEGADSWQNMEAAVSEAGAAQLVADAKMKGLTGALLYAKGTIESALISAFLPFTDSLSGMIRRIADLVGKFTTLPEPVQKAAIVFAALLAAVGPILLALPLLAGLFAALLSPIGLIGIAVAALAAAWVADFGGIQGKTAEFFAMVQPYFDQIKAWFETTIPVALAYLQGAWEAAWPVISQAVSDAWETAFGWFQTAKDWLETTIPVALDVLKGIWDAVWPEISAVAGVAWGVLFGWFETAKEWFDTNIPVALEYLKGIWDKVWAGMPTTAEDAQARTAAIIDTLKEKFETIKTKFQEVKDKVSEIWTSLVEFFAPTIERIKEGFGEMVDRFSEMGPKFEAMWDAIKPVAEFLAEALGITLVVAAKVLGEAFAVGMPLLAGFVETMVDSVTIFFEMMKKVFEGVVKFFKALIDGDWAAAWEAAKEIFSAFKDGFTEQFENLKLFGGEILQAIYDIIVNTLTDMGVDVDAVLATLKTVWDTAWTAIKDYTQTAVDAVIKLWEDVKKWFVETLPNSLETLRVSFAEKWQKIQESTVNFLNLILNPIKEIGEWLETKLSAAATTLKTFLQTFTIPNPFAALQGALSSVGEMIGGLSGKLQGIKNFLSTFSIPNPFAGWTMPEMPSWMQNLPGFATGTNYAPGGMAIVGERGPELVNLPRGSKVHTANSPETQNALNGGGGNGATTIYNLVANYGYQSPGTLADDITLLQMMAA